jgi:hypothetical protein
MTDTVRYSIETTPLDFHHPPQGNLQHQLNILTCGAVTLNSNAVSSPDPYEIPYCTPMLPYPSKTPRVGKAQTKEDDYSDMRNPVP